MGHRGILLANAPEKIGLPPIRSRHWDPLFSLAQEAGLPINFHIGFGVSAPGAADALTKGAGADDPAERGRAAIAAARLSARGFLSNADAIIELILAGICERFPRLNFVSVESGYGYVPYLLETLDWQWAANGVDRAFPNQLLPSEYFRRQIYATFWYERLTIDRLVDLYVDNLMFETDFPHPTSLSPGPQSNTPSARHVIDANLGHLPEAHLRKILHTNAARLYRLDDLETAP
jgi:predicted TIM-barrel fold metal-dependent hydrolase